MLDQLTSLAVCTLLYSCVPVLLCWCCDNLSTNCKFPFDSLGNSSPLSLLLIIDTLEQLVDSYGFHTASTARENFLILHRLLNSISPRAFGFEAWIKRKVLVVLFWEPRLSVRSRSSLTSRNTNIVSLISSLVHITDSVELSHLFQWQSVFIDLHFPTSCPKGIAVISSRCLPEGLFCTSILAYLPF